MGTDILLILLLILLTGLVAAFASFAGRTEDGEPVRGYLPRIIFIAAAFVVVQSAVSALILLLLSSLALIGVFAALGGAAEAVQSALNPVFWVAIALLWLSSYLSMVFFRSICHMRFRSRAAVLAASALFVLAEAGAVIKFASSWTTNYRYGFIDASGKYVIKPAFKTASPFVDGLARVADEGPESAEGPAYFIDSTGRRADSPGGDREKQYEASTRLEPSARTTPLKAEGLLLRDDFVDGLAIAQSNKTGRFGFVDQSLNFVVEPKFNDLRRFSDGLAAVSVASRRASWGYIDRMGNLVIEPVYVDAGSFSGGFAVVGRFVKVDGRSQEQEQLRFGAIDRSGRVVVPFEFVALGKFSSGLAPACIDLNHPPSGVGLDLESRFLK
ncbi:MAG: WG repeat-containing protein [Candidatus Melainabacteria bacterium]|nr:WG repeat-containing protein [Candidatus Melainabacteria bacterium]